MKTPFVLILDSEVEVLLLQELVGSILTTGHPIREYFDEIFNRLDRHTGGKELLYVFEGSEALKINEKFWSLTSDVCDMELEELTA